MNFNKWWKGLGERERPFGTAAQVIAEKAWHAALEEASKVCQKSLEELGYQARADAAGLDLCGEIARRIKKLESPHLTAG